MRIGTGKIDNKGRFGDWVIMREVEDNE